MLFKKFKMNRMIKKIKALQAARLNNQVNDEALIKEISLYHTLAGIYGSLQGKKKFPYAREMVLECYRAAASIDDPKSQYLLGETFLEEAKFREFLEKQGVFSSTGNARQMKQLYEEALAYLTAAEARSHIQAKRLHGLCYINGWGVEPDKKKGFELVVASIDQENSWDKVPQIFAAIGLNKPEFFSELAQIRNQK